MQKYVLRPNISKEVIDFLGLPFNSIKENGVIYLTEEDHTYMGNDNIEHHSVAIWFKYIENGNEKYASWNQQYFDLFFVPESE